MKVAVVGCGIAGMAAALAFARDGHTVTVFERFSAVKPVGAGLLLQPSGLAALQALGLREAVEASGSRIARLEGRSHPDRLVLDLQYARLDPAAYGLGVRRSALFDALFAPLAQAGVELRFDTQMLRVDTPDRPLLRDATGAAYGPFDLIIAADGANSPLRASAQPNARAPIYRWGAAWASVTADASVWDGALRQRYQGARRLMGVLPTGPVTSASGGGIGGQINAAVFWSLRVQEEGAFRAGGLTGLRSAAGAVWPEAAGLLGQLRGMDEVTFSTYRHVSAWPWGRGGVVLIGDAAHAASPVLGHGANLSLADAVGLARAFRSERGVLYKALGSYRRARRPFVAWAQTVAWVLTPLFQSRAPLFGLLRDRLLPLARKIGVLERLMLRTLTGEARMPIPSITGLLGGLRLPPGA
jgi:2-polyprenyl-6-methoxyphenol hydroxylase-like FAD-dependent oxidoreductase